MSEAAIRLTEAVQELTAVTRQIFAEIRELRADRATSANFIAKAIMATPEAITAPVTQPIAPQATPARRQRTKALFTIPPDVDRAQVIILNELAGTSPTQRKAWAPILSKCLADSISESIAVKARTKLNIGWAKTGSRGRNVFCWLDPDSHKTLVSHSNVASAEQIERIRYLDRSGFDQGEIAKQMGISQRAVSRIIKS